MAARKKKRNGKRYSPAEQQAHVKAFRESGLSQARYAKKAGMAAITLSSWIKRKPAKATGRVQDGAGKFQRGEPVDLREDDFFARVKDEPLTVEEQNQRLRIALKALARML